MAADRPLFLPASLSNTTPNPSENTFAFLPEGISGPYLLILPQDVALVLLPGVLAALVNDTTAPKLGGQEWHETNFHWVLAIDRVPPKNDGGKDFL